MKSGESITDAIDEIRLRLDKLEGKSEPVEVPTEPVVVEPVEQPAEHS